MTLTTPTTVVPLAIDVPAVSHRAVRPSRWEIRKAAKAARAVATATAEREQRRQARLAADRALSA